MKDAQPQGLSRRRVEQLLAKTKSHRTAGNRIEVLSHQFLGLPYKINPLIGSSDQQEIFTVSLDGFDCVTYVETILALARSATVDEFIAWMRRIRYDGGRPEWKRRNHYMIFWIRNNIREGALRRVLPRGVAVTVKKRTLDLLPGLQARRARFTCVPKSSLIRLAPSLRTGDVILFASTRKHHDVFHCGIIVRDKDRLLMRHASRSRGEVVEQALKEFLKANRMAGVIVVRPTEGDLKD
jgi:N-acetylmuramoyl-L-alanine amidase-like protein